MKDKNIMKFQMFYFLLIGAVGCFTPYINVYLEKSLHFTGSQIGLITAISLIIGVCVVPLWGIIGDKTRKYHLLLKISLAATLVCLYFYSRQSVYSFVVIASILLEISRLGSSPMADTLSMNYIKEHGGNYGSIRGMGSLGYMLSSMCVGFLADSFGLDGPLFTSYMILIGFALMICFSFPKSTYLQENEKPEKGNFKDLLMNKRYLFIVIVAMLTQMIVDSSGQYAGNHLVVTLGGTNSLISWLSLVQILPEFLFLMVASQMIKKIGYHKFFTFALFLMAIRLYVYAFIPNAYVFIFVSLVHCLGVACCTVAGLEYIQYVVSPAVFGTALTLYNAAQSIARAIYGYGFGIVYQHFGSYCIFMVSAVVVTIAFVMVLMTHKFDEIDNENKK